MKEKIFRILLYFFPVSLFILIGLLLSCAPPKQTYYFSWRTIEQVDKYSSHIVDDVIKSEYYSNEDDGVFSSANSILFSSTSEIAPDVTKTEDLNSIKKLTNIPSFKSYERIIDRSSLREQKIIKTDQKKTRDEKKEKRGDEKRNKSAILGFLAPFVSILTSLVFTNIFGAGMLWIGPIISIIGIVLSIRGIKSKKKGLAITGLVFGLIVLSIWIALISFAVA